MDNNGRSKIVAQHRIETINFDYEISFNRFTNRADVCDCKVFSPPGLLEPRFYLKLTPHYNGSILITLYLETSKQKVYIKTSSWFVTKDDKEWKKIDYNFSLSQGGAYNIYTIPRTDLTTEANELLQNDTFTFYCQFTLDLEVSNENVTLAGNQIAKYDSPHQICEDLEKLLANLSLADFEFAIGQKTFKVHRAILSARSPVFEAMFKHDLKENKEKKVPITDIDADIFNELLKYIYTNKIPDLEKNATELLIASNKYQLDSLKSICENYLIAKLEPETMFNSLMIADIHNAPELKAQAMEFIASRASTQDILKALFNNKLFGSSQSKSLMDAMHDLIK